MGPTWVLVMLGLVALLSVGLIVRDIVRDVRESS